MLNPEPITFDRFIRFVSVLLVIAALFFLMHYLRAALQPFFIAALLAYLIYPLVQFFQLRLRIQNRALSIFATLLLLTGIGTLLWIIIAPAIQQEAVKFASLTNRYAQGLDLPAFFPENFSEKISEFLQSEELQQLLSGENIKEAFGYLWQGLGQTFSGIFGLLGGIVTGVVILLYLVFILLDYEAISDGWHKLIPPRYRKRLTMLVADLQDGMEAYFRAQTKIVLSVSILFAIGFKLIGLPLGIALGIFVGLLNYVPYLQNAGFIPAIFLGTLQSMETGANFWIIMSLILLVFTVVQLIQDAILTPRIMGDLTGLDPAIILLSLSIWGSLLGVIGMIIALPVTTLLLSYYKRFILELERKVDLPAEE
jgi:predicted PurR-regulated permease PerM